MQACQHHGGACTPGARRTAVQRWLERVTGIVLIGFGIRLATEAR